MRLRLTVRRHGLPDTPIVWVVDTSSSPSPTISQLLEAVNEAIPIESDNDWGLEDYAVELKGANGANYECLHFQHVATVMKEDDEVIIRPLLTQDIKIRRVSGRRQISAAGGHLFDGLPFGRPLLRRPADRPPISIPPRKKRRILYNDEDEEDTDQEENTPALMAPEDEHTDDDANKQLVIHADFYDEDSEDDEDFIPDAEGDDENEEEAEEDPDDLADASDYIRATEDDESMAEDEAAENPGQNEDIHSTSNKETEVFQASTPASGLEDDNESALQNVPEPQQVKIRKLHDAFPTSPMAVCKYVLKGSKGDMSEAYEAMARGFQPVKSKTSFTEKNEDTQDVHIPRTRSKAKAPPQTELDDEDSMKVDDEGFPESLVRQYDQGGLPPGSIKSGKALKFMAEAIRSSPARPRSARRSTSVVSNKSVRFAADEGSSNSTHVSSTGLTSTPFIDQQQSSAIESESSESDSDESSEADASSSEDSDDDDDSDSDSGESSHDKKNGSDDAQSPAPESSSDSSSDSSSESSSEEEPEEKSSKLISTTHKLSDSAPASLSTSEKPKQSSSTPSGQGSQATRKRNERKRMANLLDRYKKKGILPAGTTISELTKLHVNDETSPEVALVALQELRNTKNESAGNTQSDDFERRRQELLDSLASGGVDVDRQDLGGIKSTPGRAITPQPKPASTKVATDTEPSKTHAAAPQHIEPSPPTAELPVPDQIDVDGERPSTAPEAPQVNAPDNSPKTQPGSAESSQPKVRRSKIDLGAGRRLLFGALGMKAPRTKKDEDKLRADLMKDVRPLVTPKVSEPVEPQAEVEVEEAPDAWKDKIVYRAVECVQENVGLSEPPFPFVQRWDPQQQGVWSHNGKRKQPQREQPGGSRPTKKQKRRKGKHNYSEEQDYLEASYEPSYQDDSQLQYDDSTQYTGFEDEHVDDEISLQLMNDIAASTSAVSQEPEDCIPLPEDPSTLPDLKDGDAKVGMIIAFKMLDCSAETQWQPLISAYRTAVVIGDQGDGVYNLRLAMRDRKNTEKQYDDNTGKRIYGKFETADDDEDMQDDDGLLDLGFGELIEPKILQDLSNVYADDVAMIETQVQEEPGLESTTLGQQDSAEAPLSHVTEIPIHSDAPESYQVMESIEATAEETTKHDVPSQVEIIAENNIIEDPNAAEFVIVEEVLPTTVTEPVENIVEPQSKNNASTTPVPTTAKDQIAHLMKDTDFQAEIPSSVLREIQPDSMQTPGEAARLETLLKDLTESNEKAYSPKFNGLGSSPLKKLGEPSPVPIESRNIQVAHSSPIRKQKSSSHLGDEQRELSSANKPPQSSWETVDPQYESPSLSPPPARQADSSWVTEESHVMSSSPPVAQPVKRKFKPLTRRAEIGRAQAIWESFQPRKRKDSSDSENESNKGAAELDASNEKPSVASVPYPKLTVGSSFTSLVEDHGRQPDFEFDANDSIDVGTPKAPDFDAVVPRDLSPEADRTSPDSEYLPTLEALSQSVTIKRELNSTKSPKVTKSNGAPSISGPSRAAYESSEDENQPTPKASQKHRSQSQSSKSRASENSRPQSRTTAPRASQPIPAGSQIWDLTVSSDAEPEPQLDATVESDFDIQPTKFNKYSIDSDDDEDSEEGGWAPKKRSSTAEASSRRQTGGGLKTSSQTSLNTKNRRKTTAR